MLFLKGFSKTQATKWILSCSPPLKKLWYFVLLVIVTDPSADGSVTITNNTKYHNFFNGGEQDRIHLVACVLENPFKKSN